MAAATQSLMVYRAIKLDACLACTTLGSYILAVTLANDIDGDLNVINASVKARRPVLHIFKQMSEFVRAHSNGKRLLETFSEVYENILTSLFTWCTITICLAMLMIQMQIVKYIEFYFLIQTTKTHSIPIFFDFSQTTTSIRCYLWDQSSILCGHSVCLLSHVNLVKGLLMRFAKWMIRLAVRTGMCIQLKYKKCCPS